MSNENRETIQRALGILEGVGFCADTRVQDAIDLVVNMISEVLDKEAKDE